MSTADWLNLILHFAVLSMLAVGGAIATVPEMHRYLVTQQGWLSESAFNSSITLAQAAPGPNVLFVALMGWNFGLAEGGPWALWWAVLGACVCLVSVLLPSSITTYLITRWAHRNRELRSVRAFKAGWGGVVWKTLGEDGPPVVNVNGPRYGAIHGADRRLLDARVAATRRQGLVPYPLEPSLQDLVTEQGPMLGKPKFYTINAMSPALRAQ